MSINDTLLLIDKLFVGFSIQRWTDHPRPMPLVEMDKTAHKMLLVYCLGRYEEDYYQKETVQWYKLIQAGIFELLRRIVISDIKATVYRKIRLNHRNEFQQLNKYVLEHLLPLFDDRVIKDELVDYINNDDFLNPVSKKIINASHLYASYWELQLIKHVNPFRFIIQPIEDQIVEDLKKYDVLYGVRRLLDDKSISNFSKFMTLVGSLRFQIRWSTTPRIPPTSVLGHSMMVASLSYIFSKNLKVCNQRTINNFFGGLFHDLPETVTRDIVSPTKKLSPRFEKIISDIEKEMLSTDIDPLIENKWLTELKCFRENPYKCKKDIKKKPIVIENEQEMNDYDHDRFDAYDGPIVKMADNLATFLEAERSIRYGITTDCLEEGKKELKDSADYKKYLDLDIKELFTDGRL